MAVHYGGTLDTLRRFWIHGSPLRGHFGYSETILDSWQSTMGPLDTSREFKSLESPLWGSLNYLLCVHKKSLSLLRLTKSLSHLRPYGGLLQLGLTWVWQTLWWPPLRGQEVSASFNRVLLQLGSTLVWQTLWWPPLRRTRSLCFLIFTINFCLLLFSRSLCLLLFTRSLCLLLFTRSLCLLLFSKIDIPLVVI